MTTSETPTEDRYDVIIGGSGGNGPFTLARAHEWAHETHPGEKYSLVRLPTGGGTAGSPAEDFLPRP